MAKKEGKEAKKQMRKEMFLERMMVAYDLASAFRFLHGKRLVHRDIKSANIGFDVKVRSVHTTVFD